ncbi:MAG: hypothetical protein K9N48_02715 [Verrucomicrobia bacterium]|nr:hypothetical protein [Verrucomicrobiota bacterium]MCF7708238.1 hypothetical protein [Verrucomicrobiota bacterium]
MTEAAGSDTRRIPVHGWIGLVMIAVFWYLNWGLSGIRTSYLFFPLWLGYILFIDSLVLYRSGTSILKRKTREFIGLFFLSAPCWWLFEIINKRTQNWEYLGGDRFGDIEYFLLSSLSFSTVIPAVFESAELVSTFKWTSKLAGMGPNIRMSKRLPHAFAATGIVMMALLLTWPRVFYPFVWLSVYFLVESINISTGRRNLVMHLAEGDWRPVIALSLGALLCGFFWELWNFYSYPKWIYHTPGTEFLHIFEMPLLGFLGYLPFAWELYAIRNLVLKKGVYLFN